jgi:hypothetical protein
MVPLKAMAVCPDVDELRSSLADRMNTKNLTGILVEKKFQHAHFIPL